MRVAELLQKEKPAISIIIPTLNEELHLDFLLNSLKSQSNVSYETLIIDGGSKDKTFEIARKHNARIIDLPGYGEFVSRNIGVQMAKGNLLVFTCADVIFPESLLSKIIERFERNPRLIALTVPDSPFDAPFYGRFESFAYNFVRHLFAVTPKPFKRFITSTNFLAVRRRSFLETGGFLVNDINADGLMGRKLLKMGDVEYFSKIQIFSSARRMTNMHFFAYNKHYLYALENYFFLASKIGSMNSIKTRSKNKHGEMHKIQ